MILCFGSINADLVFELPQLPHPGETVLGPGYLVAPGGKGANQAVAAARAGASVTFAGAVGDDEHGRMMRRTLAADGIDLACLAMSPRPTGLAMIAVDPAGENLIIVASGANLDVAAAQVPDAMLRPGTTLLCQNEVAQAEMLALVARARQAGARIVLNAAPVGGLVGVALPPIDVLVVNEHEAAALTGHAGPEAAAGALLARGALAVAVTLGGAGALAADATGVRRLTALPVTVVDTTGAGDAFVGVLAARLDADATFDDAMSWAVTAGGLACERLGAQAALPTAAAIRARLCA